MAIHLGPPVARRLMRPTRGLGSAPTPANRDPANRASPSYLALLRVELAAFHSAFSWAGPQESDIVTVALVLALRRTGVTRYLALGSSDFPQPDRLPGQAAAIRPPSLTA